MNVVRQAYVLIAHGIKIIVVILGCPKAIYGTLEECSHAAICLLLLIGVNISRFDKWCTIFENYTSTLQGSLRVKAREIPLSGAETLHRYAQI